MKWHFFIFAMLGLSVFGNGTALAANYVVNSTADSGAGSLRQAIQMANTNPGPDTITFQFTGTAPFTITPSSSLPTVSDTVTIDATTQTGFSGTPLVELNGASAGSTTIGLKLAAPSNIVRGLVINRFKAQGMELDADGNVIAGNFIGTDPSGTTAQGNASFGIWVKSSANLIGGTNSLDMNLISGSNNTGIYISGGNSNLILGNIIGLAAGGGIVLSNANNGIVIDNAAGNVIGGTTSGARNIISGNGSSGIYLNGTGSAANSILGNIIGLNNAGSSIASNRADGITLNGAAGNLIRGNVISGNSFSGVSISSSTANGNVIQGNLIGTDATGKLALGNRYYGVSVSASATNQISGNVISGNLQDGLLLTGGSASNLVTGNLIGVDVTGTNALKNANNGISISGSSFNQIGLVGVSNVISGNGYNGISILTAADIGNAIAGNLIGTDATGQKAITNALAGVRVQGCSNIIGAGNVISGNGQQGVWLVSLGGSVAGNIVRGNIIGLNAAGAVALPNGNAGIGVSAAAGNLIGGSGAAARNIISANGDAGIFLVGSATTNNQIQGNYIGTDVTGAIGRGNSYEGIYSEQASANFIGAAGAGNVISANGTRGIWFTNSSWNIVQGNYIGTKADGTNGLGNVNHGIDLDAKSANNFIGGATAGAGNRLAFAQGIYAGVRVRDGSTNNLISGNAIFSNGSLGIDLGAYGVTANYACQSGVPANAANNGQNFPILSNAYAGTVTRIVGGLNSKPNQSYTLQFFASPTMDSSGYGEGQVFLGQTNLTLGSGCFTNFGVTLPVTVAKGWFITATATGPANNTSEFSIAVMTAAVPSLRLNAISASQVQVSWTNGATGLVLQQAFSLTPPVQWNDLTNQPVLSAGYWSISLPKTNATVFYRLTAP